MTDTTTLAPTDAEIDHLLATHWPAVFAVTEAVIQWRLRHAVREAIAKWGAPVPASGELVAEVMFDERKYIQYTIPLELLPVGAKFYTAQEARVPLDRIARDLLFDVKNRVNALVLLTSSERRESEIRIKQDIADFLAAPPAQEARDGCTLSSRIAELTEQHGSLRAAARSLDFDPGYLARLQSGEKCSPSPALLERLGLRQVITYERGTT